MRLFISLLFLLLGPIAWGQNAWQWSQRAKMPMAISNNAVTGLSLGDSTYVFSFGGIDTSKSHSGIVRRSFRYHYEKDDWDTIPPLPDTAGKIASGASSVDGKLYIMGGYYVASNGNETSSDKIHIYDPQTSSYLSDGTPIPTPIDDHVQASWRDSLIYVITGWSNGDNVNDVQIYDPSSDTWQSGTSVPNTDAYEVFGASGTIVGDTIYYAGGAEYGFNFPMSTVVRKGVIDPNDPTQINWSKKDSSIARYYRSACTHYGERIFWIGGSRKTYNYDGVAYDGSGGVSPSERVMTYDPQKSPHLEQDTNAAPPVMDLRGIARIDSTHYIIAGGMLPDQKVSKRTYELNYDPTLGTKTFGDRARPELSFFPNPAEERFVLSGSEGRDAGIRTVRLTSVQGKEVKVWHDPADRSFSLDGVPKGFYVVRILSSRGQRSLSLLVE